MLRPYILPEGFAVPLVPGGGREVPPLLCSMKTPLHDQLLIYAQIWILQCLLSCCSWACAWSAA